MFRGRRTVVSVRKGLSSVYRTLLSVYGTL